MRIEELIEQLSIEIDEKSNKNLEIIELQKEIKEMQESQPPIDKELEEQKNQILNVGLVEDTVSSLNLLHAAFLLFVVGGS